ncbi:MAG: ABC transporter permease [Anaerolineae bacterium]|nr:ABC transporter permease [Anaerolineae bacterium]
MKLFDIALKDMLRSFRSLFAVGMMVAAPLLITGLIYLAFGGISGEQRDMSVIQVGLINADAPSPDISFNLGQTLVEMFTDASVVDWLNVRVYPDVAGARAALDRQEIGIAVIIPAGLSAAALSGEPSPDTMVLILHDPTLTLGPQVVGGMVMSLLDGVTGGRIAIEVIQERHAARGLAFAPTQIPALIGQYQTWYTDFQRATFHHPTQAALRLVAPGVDETAAPMSQILGTTMAGQMIFFAFYTAAYSMTSILREQEEGTLARLFTTPTDRTVILGGKFLAVILTVILQGAALMLFAGLTFGIHWGRTDSALLALVAQVVATAGLGVLLIALVKHSRQAGPVLGGGLTVLGMLGGLFTVGIQGMPAFLDVAALFTPHGWVLKGWRLALAGQAPNELLLPFFIAVAIGAAMFALGAILFRRRFA